MVNIILCGGSGTRLWPVSREFYPKQFCNIIDDQSLFQDTLLRNKNLCDKAIIVTNEQQYPLAKEQADILNIENIEFILEPLGRNTAPAISIACMSLNDDDIAFVTPSDHYIKDKVEYYNVLKKAKKLAESGFLVTFGIKPTYPETGYGYIESEGENVISFKEKPNENTAKKYMASGKYYWNSGMFAFKVKTFIDELKKHSKEIFTASQEAFNNKKTENIITRIFKPYMEKIPANSIDYAVMEKSDKIKMLSLDVNWSDLGSFESIYNILRKDENGNAVRSLLKNISIGSKNNLLYSDKRQITLIDVEDLIVIDTNDALLISKRGSSQKIKEEIIKLEKISPNITKSFNRA
jgi:mannose-1-phosphate guanylyltransferase